MKISAKTVSLGKNEIKFTTLEQISDVKQGLATGDNISYLYKNPSATGSYRIIDKTKVLAEEEISEINNDEKLRIKIIENGIHKNMFKGKTIVPYDKGGSSDIEAGRLRNYFAESDFFIDWSESNVKRMKTLTIAQRYKNNGQKNPKKYYETKIASRLQNIEYYFKNGITFSITGIYAPTYRSSSDSIFDVKGSCIFLHEKLTNIFSNNYLQGILCSKICRYFQKSFIQNNIDSQVESIKKNIIPICEKSQKQEIEKLVKEIVKKQKKDPDYNYQDHEQKEIDNLVYEIFGLDKELIDEVETWYARRYPKLVRN